MSTTVEGRSILWCYFGETCGYHSRLDGCSACLSGGGLPVSTANRNLLPVYNFVQKCILLAKNVMFVLATI